MKEERGEDDMAKMKEERGEDDMRKDEGRER